MQTRQVPRKIMWVNEGRLEDHEQHALPPFLRALQSSLSFQTELFSPLEGISTNELAETIEAHARATGSDLIVLERHEEYGLKRILSRDLTTVLVDRSHVPVFVMPPATLEKANLPTKVIFPTDFREHSKEAFREVVQLVKKLSGTLVLFHVIPDPGAPVLDFDYGSRIYELNGEPVGYRAHREHEVRHDTRHTESWAEWARHQGVFTEVEIDEGERPVYEFLTNYWKEKPVDLIVLEAHSGPIRSALVGGVSHKVIRNAPFPVWILPRKWVEALPKSKAA